MCVYIYTCGWVGVCATVPASIWNIYESVCICLAPQPMAMGNTLEIPVPGTLNRRTHTSHLRTYKRTYSQY